MELLHNATATMDERRELLDRLRTEFIGLDTSYRLADGRRTHRIYLDSAASNLRLKVADEIVRQALAHYANTHSHLHFGASVMTRLYRRAHDIVLDFAGASDEYTAIFHGNGVTGCLNRLARVLAAKRPGRDTVITTIMEHHANDLPHRKHVGRVVHVPVDKDPDGEAGRVNMAALEEAVRLNADRLNYVAVTAASNVTGVLNPVHDIARIAHESGALIVVDAAQSAAHHAIDIKGASPEESIDALCLSGHKIYAPGSPGVIVARKALFEGLEPEEVGGGIVYFVDTKKYNIIPDLPDREETGTPNLPGAFALGATLALLGRIGMDVIEEDERTLTQYALDRFEAISGVHLYGSHRLEVADRIGVVTFNVDGMQHGLVTAILNDYFGIAVRNECFCAQPFVRQLLGLSDEDGVATDPCMEPSCMAEMPGMVRISLGLYNTPADIDAAARAVSEIILRADEYRSLYEPVGQGDWKHRSFRFDPDAVFSIEREVENWAAGGGTF